VVQTGRGKRKKGEEGRNRENNELQKPDWKRAHEKWESMNAKVVSECLGSTKSKIEAD